MYFQKMMGEALTGSKYDFVSDCWRRGDDVCKMVKIFHHCKFNWEFHLNGGRTFSRRDFLLAAAVNLIDFGNLKIFIASKNEKALAPHHTTLQTKCFCPCSRHKRPWNPGWFDEILHQRSKEDDANPNAKTSPATFFIQFIQFSLVLVHTYYVT